MVRSIAILRIAMLWVTALPAGADAQNPPTRQGFFAGLGIGAGSFGGEGAEDREEGVAGHVTLGGTLTPQLLLAAEITGWTRKESGARLTHSNVSAIVQFYPMMDGGLFLRGGIGASRREASASGDGFSISLEDDGLGATAGLGHDIRVGSNVSITPYGLFVWGNFEGGSANHLQAGLGVTWH